MSLIEKIKLAPDVSGRFVVDGVADGHAGFVLASIAADPAREGPVLFVARDGQMIPMLAEIVRFAVPGLPILELPAWDCLPYDRVSPGGAVAARRLSAMTRMAALKAAPHRALVLASANAVLQRMPSADAIAAQGFFAQPGSIVNMESLVARLEGNGFERVSTVREVGEYAVRGGILDLFVPGAEEPLRLDFFGDTLETIRAFDPATQRSTGQKHSVELQPMSEVTLSPETISRFRRGYIEQFGAPLRDDALYAAVSEGRRFAGMEHWLPLFHEKLETVFDYLDGVPVVFDHLAKEAMAERHTLILDHYEARKRQSEGGAIAEAVPYRPMPPDGLYLSPDEVTERSAGRQALSFTAFEAPETGAARVIHAGGRAGRSFADVRADPAANVFSEVVGHIAALRKAKRRVILAGWTAGSADRLSQILTEHGLGNLRTVDTLADAEKLPAETAAMAVLPLETGFETERLAVIAEQDILGDRLVRRAKRKRAADFISEVASLSAGDIVVHADHGIGRFAGG